MISHLKLCLEEIIFSKPGTEARGEAFKIVCTSVIELRSKALPFAVYGKKRAVER